MFQALIWDPVFGLSGALPRGVAHREQHGQRRTEPQQELQGATGQTREIVDGSQRDVRVFERKVATEKNGKFYLETFGE